MQPRSARFSLSLQLIYDDQTAFVSGAVVDMSESGVFLETPNPLAPGVEVRITPLLPEVTGVFELRGVVVRQGEAVQSGAVPRGIVARVPGMAIRFISPDPETLEQLRALFARGTPKP